MNLTDSPFPRKVDIKEDDPILTQDSIVFCSEAYYEYICDDTKRVPPSNYIRPTNQANSRDREGKCIATFPLTWSGLAVPVVLSLITVIVHLHGCYRLIRFTPKQLFWAMGIKRIRLPRDRFDHEVFRFLNPSRLFLAGENFGKKFDKLKSHIYRLERKLRTQSFSTLPKCEEELPQFPNCVHTSWRRKPRYPRILHHFGGNW